VNREKIDTGGYGVSVFKPIKVDVEALTKSVTAEIAFKHSNRA